MERNDEKAKEVKVKYEKQLIELRTELKSLRSARKEHAKAMKKNVRMCSSVHAHTYVHRGYYGFTCL